MTPRKTLVLTAVVLLVTLLATPAGADTIVEDFQSHTATGETAPPAGWTLIDTAGAVEGYLSVDSSVGAGGHTGFAGQVSSLNYVHGALPGAYIVHSTAFDPKQSIVGSFSLLIPNEDVNDDALFIMGDVGSGLTLNANDALCLKLIETGAVDPSRLHDGAGSVLDAQSGSRIPNDTWHRVSFSWMPTSGSTGKFRARIFESSTGNAVGSTAFTENGFTFAPSSVQFGFGSVNDKGRFDNINININVPAISEDFESQAVGTHTRPAGWVLIDAKGAVDPTDYTNVAGSNGAGGSTGVAGEVDSLGSSATLPELPSRYIASTSIFDPTLPISGSFEVKISDAPGPGSNDAIFIFGDIGSGLTHKASDVLGLKLVEDTTARLINGTGSGTLLNDTSVQVANNHWYRVEFDWTPTAASAGDFSVSVFDLISDAQMGNTLSATGVTFNPWLVQFGFGSLNDTAVFDNIKISVVPEPATIGLLILAMPGLFFLGRRSRRGRRR